MGFVHLHVHSQFSLLDGTMDVEDIANLAKKAGQTAVALTDTCNLYGAVPFYKACKGAGVQAILAAELHVQPEGVSYEDGEREQGGYQLVALVEDEVGYRNLCHLVTEAIFHGTQYKPRVDLAQLRARREGLIFLTGGRKGAFGRPLLRGDRGAAERAASALRDAVGEDRLYLELRDHGVPGDEEVNALARELSARLEVPTVVTNAVHYAEAEDATVHELLNAIALGASLGDERRLVAPTDQAWFKTEQEMRELFPDDLDAVERTVEIAARCHYKFKFGTYHFPATTPPDVAAPGEPDPDTAVNWAYFYKAFPPPRSYGLPDPVVAIPEHVRGAGNLNGYFRWYGEEGLRVRFRHVDPALHAQYLERLEYEILMIQKMGFAAYFLIVAEFINWSKDNGIPVGPGRGSAAGSLVAWATGITDIDPIRFDLLFERFLNPERVSMPDVDVDFCQDRREESIAHVREKYGAELVSQIITYGTLKAKAAVRDVARVLDLSFTESDRIAKLIPEALGTTLDQALQESEQLKRLVAGDPKVRRVLRLALGVENLCRQTGVHAAGVVIADAPLVGYAPLYRDGPDGGPVVQYDMKSAETIGLIKFDFLGLKTLDQIRDAVVMIKENHGVELDMALIPTEDEPTFKLLQEGDALGVFQLESSGMRELLARLRPTCLDDLVALVALYRPGPLSSGMVDDFVDRKHGRQEVSYPLPMLEPILKNTYGTIVYQEQVMQVAQVMSGYSLGEADLLRRAMGKKKPEEMAAQKTRFMSGAEKNGIDVRIADDIFELLSKFAAYGFNKSHSAAYGYVSYQTAYLKAHWRPEYMAALMTIEAANTDKILIYIQDCRRAGIQVLPVDVNTSQRHFSVPKQDVLAGRNVIRFGMAAVKNVGDGSIQAILEARRAGGPFRTLIDLLERVDPKAMNRRVVESLVKAGAFDSWGVPRSALMEGVERAMEEGARRRRDRESGQGMLFAMAPRRVDAFRFADVPEWPLSQKLALEREVLGLYLSGHPMEAFAVDERRFGTCAISDLNGCDDGIEVRIVGVPSEVKTIKTRRGDRMAFVTLEDSRGGVECVFFAEPWMRSQAALTKGGPVLVTGRLEKGEESHKVLASTAELIEEARARTFRTVHIHMEDTDLGGDRIDRLKALLETERGECEAFLVVRSGGRFKATFTLTAARVAPTVSLEEGVLGILGRPDAVALA
jgi:DNA polymerase-3 subunit alpha